jgi:hypothetical protein
MTFKAKRISELDSLTSIVSGDLIPIIDVSDTAAGTTKKATIADLSTAVIAAGNITIQGNTFNGASQLVQLNASTQLPAVSGVNLTNLNASNLASGTIGDARLSANVTVQGNTFNGASQLVQLNASSQLPACSGLNLTNLNASNLASGTINDARLSSNVTLQGNTFNGASQLVQLNASTQLPAISGVNLTNLNASNVTSGTLADGRLSSNVELKIKTVVPVTASGVRPILNSDADAYVYVTHTSGTVDILCSNDPQFAVGQKTTVICNSSNAVSISADSSVTVYYVSSLGLASTIAPGGTLTPTTLRGRIFTIYCVATNTYFIEGANL